MQPQSPQPYAPVIIKLLQGAIYSDDPHWERLQSYLAPIKEYFGKIGLQVPRMIGYALYRIDTRSLDIPWHRVVNAKGEISHSPLRHGTDYKQRLLLEQEGIKFSPQGKINLRDYQWQTRSVKE